MTSLTAEGSPQAYARAAGLLYLMVIAAGIIAQIGIAGSIIVEGDASATAARILADRDLFQLGFTIYLIEMTCQIAMTALFYILLRPVNRNIALLALVFELVGCTIKTLSRLFFIAPLLVLGDFPYLDVVGVPQLQAAALLLLNINNEAAGIALPFFGISTFLYGYLIFKSTFLPHLLGVLSMLAGVGWVTFLYPPIGNQWFPYILLLGLIGSAAKILWLLVKGVDAAEWRKRALEPA